MAQKFTIQIREVNIDKNHKNQYFYNFTFNCLWSNCFDWVESAASCWAFSSEFSMKLFWFSIIIHFLGVRVAILWSCVSKVYLKQNMHWRFSYLQSLLYRPPPAMLVTFCQLWLSFGSQNHFKRIQCANEAVWNYSKWVSSFQKIKRSVLGRPLGFQTV